MLDFNRFKFNFALLLKEVASRNIKLRCVGDTDIVEAQLGTHFEYFINYKTRLTPSVYQTIFSDKYYSKTFLKEKGISVTPGAVFHPDDAEKALIYANHLGYPVVVKPVNASQGHLVFANLQNEEEFLQAFNLTGSYAKSRSILVEKHFYGDDYRFLVIADKDIAVAKRTTPKIIGDGHSTIKEIIQQENFRRMNPRTTCLCEIQINDAEGIRTLANQGLTESSIPHKGQVIQLRNNANVSTGAECENFIDRVHPSFLALARHIHSLFPGNSYLCIDILASDVTIPACKDNYAFCEFNPDPGFSLHEMPSKGAPHYVVKTIVDLLFSIAV